MANLLSKEDIPAFVNFRDAVKKETGYQEVNDEFRDAVSELDATTLLKSEFDKIYKDYESLIPVGDYPKNLKDAEDYTKKIAYGYAKKYNIPTNEAELKNIAKGELVKLANQNNIPIEKLPTNTKELLNGTTDIVAMAACKQYGIDPKLAKTTFESFKDGKIRPDEAKAICGMVGSTTGAALCQSMGIPAPIGAFIGGKVGNVVGDLGYKVFDSFFGNKEKKKRAEINRIINQKIDISANDLRQFIIKLEPTMKIIDLKRYEYYLESMKSIQLISDLWTTLETHIGWQFDPCFYEETMINQSPNLNDRLVSVYKNEPLLLHRIEKPINFTKGQVYPNIYNWSKYNDIFKNSSIPTYLHRSAALLAHYAPIDFNPVLTFFYIENFKESAKDLCFDENGNINRYVKCCESLTNNYQKYMFAKSVYVINELVQNNAQLLNMRVKKINQDIIKTAASLEAEKKFFEENYLFKTMVEIDKAKAASSQYQEELKNRILLPDAQKIDEAKKIGDRNTLLANSLFLGSSLAVLYLSNKKK